jgi:hypothetical protein
VAIYTASGDSASIAAGTTETNDQLSTAATAMLRLVRHVVGQSATTTSGQFIAEAQRASAVGGTPTAITPDKGQVRDAAASTTHGVSAAEPTYTGLAVWHKSGNVLAGVEQTWQRGQSEIWVPPSAFFGVKFTPVGAAMTARWGLEVEEIG